MNARSIDVSESKKDPNEVGRRIVRKHYGLNRPVTDDELRAEIANLRRRHKAGSLDTNQGYLKAALTNAGYIDKNESRIARSVVRELVQGVVDAQRAFITSKEEDGYYFRVGNHKIGPFDTKDEALKAAAEWWEKNAGK
jgi:hypothetical protein